MSPAGVMAAYISYGIEAHHILTAVIMTAPGAILLSKILVPETEKPETYGSVGKAEDAADANVLDAAARGTRDGLHLALNIAAMLISFLALVELLNMGLRYFGLTLQELLGMAMTPVAYMLGVAWQDCKGGRRPARHAHGLERADRLQGPGVDEGPAPPDRSLGGHRQLRALRIRQFQLDRHSARRHRSTRPRAAT